MRSHTLSSVGLAEHPQQFDKHRVDHFERHEPWAISNKDLARLYCIGFAGPLAACHDLNPARRGAVR